MSDEERCSCTDIPIWMAALIIVTLLVCVGLMAHITLWSPRLHLN